MLKNFSKISRYFIRNSTNFKTKPNNYLKEKLENVEINQLDDWQKIRNEILTTNPHRQINEKNLDALTIGVCTSLKKYDLARNYLEFLNNQQITINLATFGKYLKLYYMKQQNENRITDEDQDEIIRIYKKIIESYQILDPLTIENIIIALSLTKQWRETIELLRNENLVGGPTTLCYNAVIAAAFRQNEPQLAWQLLNEMLENNKIPDNSVYSAYFERVEQLSNDNMETISGELEKLFKFLQENNLVFDGITAKNLKNLLAKFKINASTVKAINNNNLCMNCYNALRRFDLTDHEFDELKTRILKNVIIGRNVFNKTTPIELEKFQNFVTTLQQHDVVIDGLNVAHSVGGKKTPLILSNVVATVVSYFLQRNKTILLLGRQHMNIWPQKNWQFIKENTTIFLTENLSQDDPFLLYCALHCGKNTIIVTKDLMRGHRYLLKDLHYQNLFNRWLTQRQYQLIRINHTNGKPIFKMPKKFTSVPQKNGGFWHVPFMIPLVDGKEPEVS